MIRALVADDQEIVRAGFSALLDTQADITVVASAADGDEAVRLSREHSPDVVLMDVRMPVMDGIEATRRLCASEDDHRPRILILTTFDLDEYVYDALHAGASGFLLKDVPAESLFEAVRVIAAGDALLAPAITRRLIAEFARLRPRVELRPDLLSALTPREKEILGLLAEGLSNHEIAERLVLSDETVKTHVSHVLRKLGLRDRAQAVVVAYESGLVVPRS
ncbi:MAG TPA: response regulator transcription factor [Gaiella sp.]|nr:response regulator transcription factor [Gaiella sp.]